MAETVVFYNFMMHYQSRIFLFSFTATMGLFVLSACWFYDIWADKNKLFFHAEFIGDSKNYTIQKLMASTTIDCVKWAVSTTIFGPSPAILQLLHRPQKDLCLVVVGDQKTNDTEWQTFQQTFSQTVFFLPLKIQSELKYSILDFIPINHFSRKNVGFLFAIQHGAEKIYDFDDDNFLKANQSMFDKIWQESYNPLSVFTFQSTHHLFNPYPVFRPVDINGDITFVWPRGFPLEFIHDDETFNVSLVPTDQNQTKIAIYQSSADIDPDVDAIYRMTGVLPVRFSRYDTILAVPPGVFSPWNAQATIFTKQAFFGCILPISVTGRVADIWRSFMTERLLWTIGYQIAFTSPWVNQYRNPHSYHADFLAEHDLYNLANNFIKEIMNLDYNAHDRLSVIYLKLVALLVKKEYLKDSDYSLATAWVRDLNAVGYEWPEIIPLKNMIKTAKETRIIDNRKFSDADLNNPDDSFQQPHDDITDTKQKKSFATIKDTAVCITGQLRTLNLNPSDPDFPPFLQPMTTQFTAHDMHGHTVVRPYIITL